MEQMPQIYMLLKRLRLGPEGDRQIRALKSGLSRRIRRSARQSSRVTIALPIALATRAGPGDRRIVDSRAVAILGLP